MRLIDADALKEWIDEYVSVFKKSDNKDIKGYIEHQPTIEPKSGEWIDISEWHAPRQKCSICETIVVGYGSNFCPNCGAMMKTAENERDYERAIEQMQYDMLYEPTYNPEDGSM